MNESSPMKLGKVPYHLLEELLGRIKIQDPRVLLGPHIGEDAALIDYGDKILVAKTDPITFASDLIGWYAVQVNANDVACAGARPRWFLATLLLPQTITKSQINSIFDQLVEACASLGISLVGGHSEITQGLTHPIVIGCMLGEVDKDRVVTTAGAEAGDSIVVTKGIALEGSSLLARENAKDLIASGTDRNSITRASEFLFQPGIGVTNEALIACSTVEVHSLHDPTEGGLATGLWEISKASGVGMIIEEETIPILPECAAICRALDLNPLGLLASGCLVIALPQNETNKLISVLKTNGIQAWEIGHMTDANQEVMLSNHHSVRPMPTFERDEFARYLDGLS